MKEPATALEWIRKAREIPAGRADNSLERLEQTLEREVLSSEITSLREQLETHPEDADAQAKLTEAEGRFQVTRRKQAEQLVERYPNDGSYRYELGSILLESGEIDAAIGHFQAAVRNPKVRVNTLLGLGKAYLSKGFSDLAIEQLSTAKSEVPGMDDLKKEILYTLASARENAGDTEGAMNEFKVIYSADIGYRDVAEKVNQYYSQK